jgi:hypothetical protein
MQRRQPALPWRERYNWRGIALFALALALASASLWASRFIRAAQIAAGDIYVIDGDTIRIHNKPRMCGLLGSMRRTSAGH